MRYLTTLVFITLMNITYAGTITSACSAFPNFEPKTGPLALVNCEFHQQYEARISEIKKTFGTKGGRPVIMELGGQLVFLHDDKKEYADVLPASYQDLKTFDHACFALYLILSQANGNELSPAITQSLLRLKSNLLDAKNNVAQLGLNAKQTQNVESIATITLQFIDKTLTTKQWDRKGLKNYYASVGPYIAVSVNQASAIELAKLDSVVKHWLKTLTPAERKKLAVVLATSHQARDQEAALQYFAKNFGFHYGSGARNENGYILMENRFDEETGLSMLARHYLDREAAAMIFGHPSRLQTDILANGARKYLQSRQ